MFHHSVLHTRQNLFILLFLLTIKLQIYAYPYPRPFARPAVQPSSGQQNHYGQIFDKTQFKPPELEETIEEVQKILQKDPSLPRLTRGEIEELYEKVTREEYQKSVEAGDLGRADSMRALMLVLPYNTDNSTADHLQELYTRPPVTKVIDGYTQHPPIKFITPNSSVRTDSYPSGQLAATTYKPGLPLNLGLNPTTYHPLPSAPILHQLTPSVPEPLYDFQPITNQPVELPKPVQRYSSHYNAKNADFLKINSQKKLKSSQTSTVRPVADVLESLGIVSQTQSRQRFTIDDYYPAESAPRPIISSYVPLNGDFDGLRGQNVAPKITPDAYTSFKPLNIGEEIRVKPEVEDYLTRFGIVGGRKRKALKKSNTKSEINEEQSSAGTELNTASLPGNTIKSNTNAELEKLLENLQELERLNGNKKKATTVTTTPATTTTAATTESTSSSLITNGVPMLVEPKKPRRRIDPHIDINFAATGNQQSIATNEDQLAKLLDNLQELEKLRLNPENVLKKVAPTIKAGKVAATKPISTTTTPATIILSSGAQNEQLELQRILKQLQGFEKSNARTTTKKPNSIRQSDGAPFDLLQLRKLLTDDNELERLYEQARAKVAPSTTPRKTSTSTSSTTTTSTTTTTTTTPKPWTNDFEFERLQRYIAELDRARTSTSSTTTTTTTTTTTPQPTTTLKPTKKVTTDDPKIQELINRVQQLERFNNDNTKPATESILPYLGFTSRNVKAPITSVKATADDYRVPSNDFAQLQQLYQQVQEADRASFTQVEISTAATAPKYTQKGKQTQDFAQRLIDFTNDTGSGNDPQKVDSNDFVQLQKLLSKVQELERVKINVNGVVESTTETPRNKQATFAPSLVTAASIQAPNIRHPSAQIIYPENSDKYVDFLDEVDDLKLDTPAYVAPTHKPSSVSKKSGALLPEITSSEELRELAYSKPINPKQSSLDKDFEKYQEFFSSLEDGGERNNYRSSYDNMEPPMIQKTVTQEPPRFFPTKKPQDILKPTTLTNQQQADLNELQKLLSNAQELGKLGVTLPKSLAEQIESKLSKTTEIPISKPAKAIQKEPVVNVYLDRYGLKPKTTMAPIADASEKVAVFSLTTPKSPTPKEAKPTTDSPLELPVFSATKIIEAAIKQAANRIGVTTEQPQGFRRRSDDEVVDLEDSEDGEDDMLGEFSEMNYQIAIPEINRMDELVDESKTVKSDEVVQPADITEDLDELQRLIGNLQELQKLNISISTDMLRLADTKYLESFKPQLTTVDDTSKTRRQSATPAISTANTDSSTTKSDDKSSTESNQSSSTTTILSTTEPTSAMDEIASTTAIIGIPTTPTAPTHVTLGIGLDESDVDTAESNDKSISSFSTSTTTEEAKTEEPRNGSLADLEASFGPDPNKEEPLPPKKKNGFYFLADWNSFLEVGADDDQVIVRLNPKIGDPRLFIPVKIP